MKIHQQLRTNSVAVGVVISAVMGVVLQTGCQLFQTQETSQGSKSRAFAGQSNVLLVDEIDRDTTTTIFLNTGSEAIVTLLRYSRYISSLNERELDIEFFKIDTANEVNSTQRSTLKLAVLLSLYSAKFNDDLRAEKLLHELIQSGRANTPAMREYAHMLLGKLKEREIFERKYRLLNNKLSEEKVSRKQLQQKLDELKTIETSITQRQKQ